MLWQVGPVGHIVCLYSHLGWLYNGKMKPQAYPCDVYAGKHIGKRKELSTALAVLWARWTGLWGQWPVWKGTALCPRGMGSPWLAGKCPPCCSDLFSQGPPLLPTPGQTSRTLPQRTMQAAGVPCPLKPLELPITLPVAGDKDN